MKPSFASTLSCNWPAAVNRIVRSKSCRRRLELSTLSTLELSELGRGESPGPSELAISAEPSGVDNVLFRAEIKCKLLAQPPPSSSGPGPRVLSPVTPVQIR